jgi:hypothetical protein
LPTPLAAWRAAAFTCGTLQEARAVVVFTILILVAVTVAVAIRLAPGVAAERIVFATDPDRPHPFGYRMSWLALRTRDTAGVVEALGLAAPEPANWSTGLGTVYDPELGERFVFVTPPVDGWTFVVGLRLPHPAASGLVDKLTPLLVGLGGRFIEIQYYMSYPLLDLFAWARVVDGRLVRAFAIGDEGIVWSKGKPTREERALGLKMFELRGVKERRGDAGGELVLHPTEDHVMRLAARWSLDPTKLSEASAQPSLGIVARPPSQWRSERMRRAA